MDIRWVMILATSLDIMSTLIRAAVLATAGSAAVTATGAALTAAGSAGAIAGSFAV